MRDTSKLYVRDAPDFRIVYERLHTLMIDGIESNGFRAEYEAISFVSCLFSHVMDVNFINSYVSIFADYHNIRDRDILTTRVRFFIAEFISAVSSEAHALGVSSKFVRQFFSDANAQVTSEFASILVNKKMTKYHDIDALIKSCIEDLYMYMEKSITNAKKIEGDHFHLDVYVPIPLLIVTLSTVAIILTVMVLL